MSGTILPEAGGECLAPHREAGRGVWCHIAEAAGGVSGTALPEPGGVSGTVLPEPGGEVWSVWHRIAGGGREGVSGTALLEAGGACLAPYYRKREGVSDTALPKGGKMSASLFPMPFSCYTYH